MLLLPRVLPISVGRYVRRKIRKALAEPQKIARYISIEHQFRLSAR